MISAAAARDWCGAPTAAAAARRRAARTGAAAPAAAGSPPPPSTSVLHPGVELRRAERSTSTRRCTPTRGTSTCRRRCSSAKIRNDMLRAFLAPAPGDTRDRPRLRQRAHRSSGTRDSGAAQVGHRRQPVLRRARRSSGVDLVLGDLRRLPFADGAFTKALGARRVRAPVARGARRRAARGGARARARRRSCSSTATCGRTRRWPAGCKAVNRARRAGSSAAAWSTCRRSSCASRITSIRWPTSPTSSGRSRPPGSASRASATTRRSSAAFVENILMRHGRALARRAGTPARGGSRPAPTTRRRRARGADARPRRRSRRPAAPPTRRCGLVTWLMKLDVLALRADPVGPVLRAAGEGRRARQAALMRSSTCALDQRVPGTTGGVGPRAPPWPRAWRRSATRSTCSRHAGGGPFPDGRGALARHGAAARAARTCAGCAPARCRGWRARAAARRRHRALPQLRRRGHPARRARPARRAVLEVNAPVVDYPGSPKALARSRCCSSSRCAAGATASAARADLHRHADRRHPAAFVPPDAGRRDRVGRRHRPLPPGRRRRRCRSRATRARAWRCSPAPSARGTARIHLVARDRATLRARGRDDFDARVHRRRPRTGARPQGRRRRPRRRRASPAPCRTTAMPACLAAADIGVAPFDVARASRRCSSRSTGRRSRCSSTWRRAFRWSRPRLARLAAHRRARPRGRALRSAGARRPGRGARRLLGRRGDCAPGWARPRARARCASSAGRPTARRLDDGASRRAALARARDARRRASCSRPTRFPPICGGSGWSTYELARGLRARGHDGDDRAAAPGAARRRADASYDGFTSHELAVAAPAVPFVRNYFKNERLWARSARSPRGDRGASSGADVIHAQHVLTAPCRRCGRRAAGQPGRRARCATTGPSATGPT